MADTNTPSLNLVLPEVGASSDTWGTKINSDLTAIDNLFSTGPYLKVANGGTGAGTAATAATNLGLGTGDSPQFTAVNIGHATDTTLTRVSAGVAAIEGKNIALNGTGETLTTGTIELGAASDTTISRSAAGVIAVEGGVIPKENRANTFTANQIIEVTDNTNAALRVTQLGTGDAIVVEDSATPDATSFKVNASGDVFGNNFTATSGAIVSGGGNGTSSPQTGTIYAASGAGTNIPGAALQLTAGNGTGTGGSGPLIFYTAPAGTSGTTANTYAERMRIDKNGNVGIGVTNPSFPFEVAADVNSIAVRLRGRSSDNRASLVFDANNGAGTPANLQFVSGISGTGLLFGTADTERLRITDTGTLTSQPTYDNTGTGSTVVVSSAGLIRRTSSSIKYKKDVEALDPALTDHAIANLRPIWYRTKNAEGDDKAEWSHIGLIAEEVDQVEKRLVRYRTVEVTTDENGQRVETPLATPEPEDVDYARLSVLLLDKVKRLEARIAALEAA